jgi:phosphopantothenoylcysteine decarboxylase/phosphopantothenate--cysteine ligase
MRKKNILIGVCGGIASYKICELVRLLVKNDFSVKVMMTEAATKFITPLVFQNLSDNQVYLDMFSLNNNENIQHISLSQWAEICIIAPLSANTLSKIANGICDNFLTTVVSALPQSTKVILAPAMNENMWKNPLIQQNVNKLKKLKKYVILNPQKGELACGVYGEGRMIEPQDIYKEICKVSSR